MSASTQQCVLTIAPPWCPPLSPPLPAQPRKCVCVQKICQSNTYCRTHNADVVLTIRTVLCMFNSCMNPPIIARTLRSHLNQMKCFLNPFQFFCLHSCSQIRSLLSLVTNRDSISRASLIPVLDNTRALI